MDKFTSEETERIIARAAKMGHSDTVSRAELLRIADQMGISPGVLSKAIEAERKERTKAERKEKKRKRYIKGLISHLLSYAIVITFLFIIDLISGPGWWFYWPMLGWGIGIAFHAMPMILRIIDPDYQEPDRHGRGCN
jgi:hypothetical protein